MGVRQERQARSQRQAHRGRYAEHGKPGPRREPQGGVQRAAQPPRGSEERQLAGRGGEEPQRAYREERGPEGGRSEGRGGADETPPGREQVGGQMTNEKVQCEMCQHYRPQTSFIDAYKQFDQSSPRGPIMKSLLEVRKEETKALEGEV